MGFDNANVRSINEPKNDEQRRTREKLKQFILPKITELQTEVERLGFAMVVGVSTDDGMTCGADIRDAEQAHPVLVLCAALMTWSGERHGEIPSFDEIKEIAEEAYADHAKELAMMEMLRRLMGKIVAGEPEN